MLPPLPAPLSKALAAQGFDTLTTVQEAVLDPALAGADLLVSAQTGSGKTVAFGLALAAGLLDDADQLPPADTPRALVVAPTRELALQVQRELAWLYAGAGAVIASCVGGMDPRAERRALERGAHIAVGTPGRLRDHLERGALDPSQLATVVLDEADEMLDLGFREDLEFILQTLPENRRTLMFSATVSPGLRGWRKPTSATPSASPRKAPAMHMPTLPIARWRYRRRIRKPPSSTCCATMRPRTPSSFARRAPW
jgi:ATP-dependent RNA helicase DeaD